MKLLYFLLINFALFPAQYIELENLNVPLLEDINNQDLDIVTLNNLPHDIKILIAEQIFIRDLPTLRETTPELYRFFKTNFNQQYLDLKEAFKIKSLSYAQLKSDLDSPYKIVRLLKLLNRLYKYKHDISFINAEDIALESSKLRFAPAFLILGGKSALKNFCSNYNVNTPYATKLRSLLKSIRYDYYILPIAFIITYAITFILLIPYLMHKHSEFKLADERFSNLPQYNSTTLSNYYSEKEIDTILGCEKYLGTAIQRTYTDCLWWFPCNSIHVDCRWIEGRYLVEYLTKQYDPNNLEENSIPLIDAFQKSESNFIKASSINYPDYTYVDHGIFKGTKWVPFYIYQIDKKCLYSNNFTLVLCLSTITAGIALMILLADKIYIACKKKNKANLNVQNIYRNL